MGSFLSNFYWAPFKCKLPIVIENFPDDVYFPTSEHCYMAIKAIVFKDYDTLKLIIEAPDAKSAKALGRTIKDFDAEDWNDISYVMMTYAVLHKFQQNEDVREKLLATGNKILVEASPTDRIWGVGLGEGDDDILDENNWRGENRLGKVLMHVRDLLQP